MSSLLKLATQAMEDSIFRNLQLQKSGIYYPTQASCVIDGKVVGKCARAVYFEKTNVEKSKLTSRTIRTFEFGNLFEKQEIYNYQKLGIYVDDHVKFSFPMANILISGEVDCIVILDGKYIGVEFKTSYGESFLRQHIKGYKRNPKEPQVHLVNPLQSSPKIEHLLQVGLYLYYFTTILPTIAPLSIDEWRMVYFAIDYKIGAEYKTQLAKYGSMHKLQCWKIYTIDEGNNEYELNEEILLKDIFVEHIIDRFVYIQQHIDKKIVPKADFDPSTPDWQCAYCQYHWVCKELPTNELPDSIVNVARPQLQHA